MEDPESMIELEAETSLKCMKSGKVSRPTGFVVEMLRAGFKGCLGSLTRNFN